MKQLQELLNTIANKANIEDYEYRGLFYVEPNSPVEQTLLAHNVNHNTNHITIELGYNYSDSTNLSFVFTAWNKALGFEMKPADMNAKLNAEQMKVALNCLNELNKHIDEILQLHKGDQ